jgi:RecG-like helicase
VILPYQLINVLAMQTIYLNQVKDEDERKVLEFLQQKGRYLYGDIIRELNFSVTRGQEVIFSLISHNMIKHVDKSSYLELNVTLK